jgi:hypothetical protein
LDAGIFSSHSPERDPPSHETGEKKDAVKAADAAVNPQASLSA